ncbi:MAG: mechanosensitive ion channel domain-containing protein [Halopseudomonas sp.]
MSDTEARAMLLELLDKQQSPQSPRSMLSRVEHYSGQLQQQITRFNDAYQDAGDRFTEISEAVITDSGGLIGFLGLALMMLLGGYLAERLLGYQLHRLGNKINLQTSFGWGSALCLSIIRTLIDVISIGIFFIAAILVPLFSYPDGHPTRLTLLALISTITLVRIAAALSRALFAPYARGIRALPMECSNAIKIHRGVVAFFIAYFMINYSIQLLYSLGYPAPLNQAILVLAGAAINVAIVFALWRNRLTITQMFAHSSNSPQSALASVVSQTWPLIVTAWLFMLWAIWGFHSFVGNQSQAEKVSLSWWITLFFPIADCLLYALLSQLVALPWLQSRSFKQRSDRFISLLHGSFRMILVFIALIAVSEAWGGGSLALLDSAPGQRLLATAIDITVIVLIAYISWELIYSLIERNLPAPPVQDEDSLDGEGGGAGATRTETLLPLLRSFLLVLLLVTVILSILHSLGIQIAPLVAGAGVVGIAVGFGSQKLVQDVISGIFFLWDDAFRRGEYIETGTLKGTVEQISIRSMQLRHHLGAVQTVPYGSIETVKNLSRDWVTMKLDMRLPYDTDIEKVRKVVKKVGQQMFDDEELGPNMLLPLKSQGMTRMEESALIVRMKFTTKPGEQWVIRREAYRRVRDALHDAGIDFAHPEVRIRVPEGADASALTPEVQQAVAGRLQVRKHSAAKNEPSDSR